MSDDLDALPDPSAEELAAIDALLARGDVWDDPSPGLEDAVVTAITAEAASVGSGTTTPADHTDGTAAVTSVDTDVDTNVTSLDEQRARRTGRPRRAMSWLLAVAAAAIVVVAAVAVVGNGGDSGGGGVEVAMAATEAAPGASATATLWDRPAGLRILLDTEGLPGAPPDAFYEAWISDGTTRVSAGTFHLRGGDAPIELWAGVVAPEFTTISVTLEPLDGVAASSGDVVLVGEFDLQS